MDRRRKQIELYRKAAKLREVKFDVDANKTDKGFELNQLQNDLYKKYKFYQQLNDAISKR